MEKDLFGNEIVKHLSIKDRFIVPPFSILDGNSGDWMDRLRRWKSLNIKSEIGRNDNILLIRVWKNICRIITILQYLTLYYVS